MLSRLAFRSTAVLMGSCSSLQLMMNRDMTGASGAQGLGSCHEAGSSLRRIVQAGGLLLLGYSIANKEEFLTKADTSVLHLLDAMALPTAAADFTTSAGITDALFIAATGPLVYFLTGQQSGSQFLTSALTAMCHNPQGYEPWAVAMVLWGRSWSGSQLPSSSCSSLCDHLRTAIPNMPPYDAVTTAWAMYSLGQGSQGLWEALLARLKKIDAPEIDEALVVYLLHCLLQHASLVSGGHSDAPRPSRAEVEGLIGPLPSKLKKKVLEAYQEYIPLAPYLEGPYMVTLHILKSLPHLRALAAQSGSYDSDLPQLSSQACTEAQRVLQDPRRLGFIKRDLYFRWRQDELLDVRQRCLNDMIYILTRRLATTVLQPPDVDMLLPNRHLAVFIEDDSQLGSRTQPGSASHRDSTALTDGDHLTLGGEALESLMNYNYVPSTRFVRHDSPGLSRVKRRMLEERGWQVCSLRLSELTQLKSMEEKEQLIRRVLMRR